MTTLGLCPRFFQKSADRAHETGGKNKNSSKWVLTEISEGDRSMSANISNSDENGCSVKF